MPDSYYIDLKSYPIEKYLEVLKDMDFIPSRRILKEDIVSRFARLKDAGLIDLELLMSALKTPVKIASLAQKSGIPEEFLTILKRELSGFQRPPALLKEFPGVDQSAMSRLEKGGIRNTKQFFEASRTRDSRLRIAETYGMEYADVLDLAKLCDVSRLYGAGPVFARMLVESGTDSMPKIADADPHELYEALARINDEKGYTKAKFTEKDMAYCRNYARNFPKTADNT